MENGKYNFERGRSAQTVELIKMLREIPMDEVATYADMTKLIGVDVRGVGISKLRSARTILENHHGIIFDAVVNHGLRRATDGDLATRGTVKSVKGIRRHCKREARRIAAADYSKLTEEERLSHNTSLSMIGATSQFLSAPSIKRITSSVSEVKTQLSMKQCLVAFRGEE